MYYQSSTEIEGDGLHTLYLMNPNYIDTQSQSNMLFSNISVPHSQTPRGLSLSLAPHHKQQTGGDRDFGAGNNSSITGSKYLKAAQELLDEVVSVGNHRTDKGKMIKGGGASKEAASADKGNGAADLTTAQRQEIQMKKAKLHSMLDEAEQRCRQYDHQMHTMIAAFEQAAGPGSARSYTHLALKTILKQFRCLKSTISAEMKSLGEEGGSELSRLRFVDRQQAGHAWRSQRGLPERAVSQLRAWLFQHFLHPYPKNSDKQILAKQTGLTRSQVSNWFINARVRVWKPMVEEMYLQETNAGVTPELSSLPANSVPMAAAAENTNTYGIEIEQQQQQQGNINGFSLSLGHTLQVDEAAAYEMVDFHNRKPFPPHLLPDFVA
ncbi:hypothetical protein SASPL_122604 [Salvia splendens]|uniref:Homeobox domain-containing protein n=1 Tax=Salvia splendens TaxID=180675 RepID=A0A8X8ZT55_SALSN|nr:BEL1-like homeodomain protein 1 [Salvia splendens]KAG6415199.1 hypothetical protein SASPL_122604 [Salvia splendens]